MIDDSFLPDDFDNTVRLFPLPDLVAFPSNVVPLHIFESRYREMLEDALRGDQLITLATLLPGFDHEYYGRPPLASTACISRVVTYEKTDEGTYHLILAGVCRARIHDEIEPVRSFRRARVALLKDCGENKVDETSHAKLIEQMRKTIPAADKLIEKHEQQEVRLGSLTDILAFLLPFPRSIKLQLLAEPNVAIRTELIIAQWPLKNPLRKGPKFPDDFSEN